MKRGAAAGGSGDIWANEGEAHLDRPDTPPSAEVPESEVRVRHAGTWARSDSGDVDPRTQSVGETFRRVGTGMTDYILMIYAESSAPRGCVSIYMESPANGALAHRRRLRGHHAAEVILRTDPYARATLGRCARTVGIQEDHVATWGGREARNPRYIGRLSNSRRLAACATRDQTPARGPDAIG